MAATRVYLLARELGVKSSSIVKKCQDEGLDVKNHMAAISAGLAATIREWFSEGEHTTTLETTEKVDLKKVRIKAKTKRKTVKKKTKKSAPSKTKEVLSKEAEEPEEPEQVEAPAEPEVILPAGPMLEKPKPAKLSGPTVVRIESLEVEERPKPRRRSRRHDEPITEPLMANNSPVITEEPSTKKKPKRHKDRSQVHKSSAGDIETLRRTKFEHRRRQRDIEERRARLSAAGGAGMRLRPLRKLETMSHKEASQIARPTKAVISEPITVKDLSSVLALKVSDIIFKLMEHGTMATANQVISSDAAELIALDLGTELVVERQSSLEDLIEDEFSTRERKKLQRRPVIATMLGHVDHGKTSLLDKIRSTQVTAGEAGGITQHIGAYQITKGSHKITFLDTPGHAAFTTMRARGATMTDVVVLVVAADDGVMPQTIEVINHAKAAEVEVLVALNKCDLPGCDINRIYSQLSEYELTPVEWGGKTEIVKTSAITGEGIEDLLEHIDYISELLELKADNTIPATGWVVEAEMSSTRGVVATLLIKEGKLSQGDVLLAGTSFGKIKELLDDQGQKIKTAISSMPVEISGLSEVPQAGDKFYCLGKDLNRAKSASEENKIRLREDSLAQRNQVTLENLFSQIEAGNVKELNIILRADVQGSIDVLKKYLSELSTEEVKLKILHAATGGITEGDVVLAEASNAIIIGFNVVSEDHVAKIAESKGVEIRLYTIIYRITEDLEKSMVGLLEPEEQEKNLGRAVVKGIFKVSKIGTVAGCQVSEGIVTNKAKIRLVRDNVVIKDGLAIESLKHFKEDVRQVKAGLECGIKVSHFDDIKVDDVLDFYEIVKVARTLR